MMRLPPVRSRALLALALACLVHAPLAAARPQAGDTAPDFAGRTYDGDPITLSAYRGKVVVVSFWASWCGPCRKELPILEGIQRVVGKDRVQVVAVNIEDPDVYRRVARKMASLQILVGTDATKQAQAACGVSGIPHMVIIDPAGQIVRVHRGYDESEVDAVVKDLNEALAR